MKCYWRNIVSGKIKLLEASDAKWLTFYNLESVNWFSADIKLVKRLSII